MDFREWSKEYGTQSAYEAFGLSDHMVFVVTPGRFVRGRCGKWIGSEPLGNYIRNPDVETAKQRLRDAVDHCFETEETIIEH